jgi:hypothetical protein
MREGKRPKIQKLAGREIAEAYEALHPETKHGNPSVSRQIGETDRFTAETARRLYSQSSPMFIDRARRRE